MRRISAITLAAACAAAPLLWLSPSAAAEPYPPIGPTGGGGTFTGGGGSVSVGNNAPSLPRTGTDLQTPVLVGGASVLTGSAVLFLGYTRRRRSST
jgi:LPXTG-motif cell wall-anchored protein